MYVHVVLLYIGSEWDNRLNVNTMTAIPGSVGLPLVGDKSYEFYKDPVKFVEKNINYYKTRIFYARFLNKPTVFIADNQAVQEVLSDSSGSIELGYKAFMSEIYGDNILFSDGPEASNLRDSLSQLFIPEAIHNYQFIIDRVVEKAVVGIDTENPVCIYEFMKKVCTEICLSLFLGLDFSEASQAADAIVALTTTHWHGIISVPLPIKLPLISGSTYSQALEAKAKLLKIITSKRQENAGHFAQNVEQVSTSEKISAKDLFVNNHLLLFTSALVPKALSSLLTSVVLEVAKDQDNGLQERLLSDQELMECVLLEVQRLHPPFFGGRRLVRKDMLIKGHKVPAGHAIVYVTHSAHRDPQIFSEANSFRPDRWTDRTESDKDKLFCFGAGSRSCIGQHLVWKIFQAYEMLKVLQIERHIVIKKHPCRLPFQCTPDMTVIEKLLCRCRLCLVEGQDLSYKWLPVSRPKANVLIKFSDRNS